MATRPVPPVTIRRMSEPITIQQLQQHIRARYHDTDAARGTPGTFMWLIEEVGELATALQEVAKPDATPAERRNLDEEFADVLAWLCTLANINRVDLEAAVREKYLTTGGPDGVKH